MNAALAPNVSLTGMCSYSPASKFGSVLPHQTSPLSRHDVYKISVLRTRVEANQMGGSNCRQVFLCGLCGLCG